MFYTSNISYVYPIFSKYSIYRWLQIFSHIIETKPHCTECEILKLQYSKCFIFNLQQNLRFTNWK